VGQNLNAFYLENVSVIFRLYDCWSTSKEFYAADAGILDRDRFSKIKTGFSDLIGQVYISTNQLTESGQTGFDFG
jgi:hypothetical protein